MAIKSRYKLKTGEEVAYFPPVQNTDNPYLTEAAMYADQANQEKGYLYVVQGVGHFEYKGGTSATAADYKGLGANKIDKIRIDGLSNPDSNILRIISPEGGQTRHFFTNQPGAIKITFPVNTAHEALFSIDVDLFGRQYTTNPTDSAKIHISGLTNSNNPLHFSVMTVVSDNGLDYPIRFGNDGTNFCIWIAEADHIFDSAATVLSNVHVGKLITGTFDDWKAPFDLTRVTTFDTVQLLMENNLPIADFNKLENKAGSTVTGTSLDLSNVAGNNYNYAAFSSATTYTTTTPVINGFARCFINAASEPTITGATKKAGAAFTANVNMEMVVESPDGASVEFYFVQTIIYQY